MKTRATLAVMAECYYHLSLDGSMFKELQLAVLVGDPAAMPSEEEKNRLDFVQAQCPAFSRAGTFQLQRRSEKGRGSSDGSEAGAQARVTVTYTYGSGDYGVNAREDWFLQTECPRALVVRRSMMRHGNATSMSHGLHLLPAPGSSAAWHG